MTQRPHVPKFGNWENEANVPYTVFFDNARKGRTGPGGKMINPNDPEENPDAFSQYASPAQAFPARPTAEPEKPVRRGAVKQDHERKEDGGDIAYRKITGDLTSQQRNDLISQQQRYGGEANKRTGRKSGGSDNSFERSPLHNQARNSGKGGAPSPVWEGKGLYDGHNGTPGRSRLRQKGDESPDRAAAVPKFGDWEKDPASADGYTHIFNVMREEKNTGGRTPTRPNESPYSNVRKSPQTNSAKSCCFPWGGK